MNAPRIMITAGASGSGKTTFVCGLLQCLTDRQIKAASFKCGPDYIDPMFHRKVIGTPSKNLDTFFTDRETTRRLFAQSASQADFSVIEGVMGYYDGAGMTNLTASSYDLAQTTDTPVVLLVNGRGMSLSIAAYIKGFLEYKKDSNIKGVILNQVSKPLYDTLKPVIEEELGVHVYGYLPKLTDCVIESRHLGLITPDEMQNIKSTLKRLAAAIEETVEVDGLLTLGAAAPEMEDVPKPDGLQGKSNVRIAVARDEAFQFYYEDNFRLLKELGAELVEFSPLYDTALPSGTDGLILGGGYPELYLPALSTNRSMLASIRNAIADGMPYLAECGGFLYLHDEMEDIEGHTYPMAGVIEGKAYYTGKLGRFGYITLHMKQAGTKESIEIKAHEFHYYDSTNNGSDGIAAKPFGKRTWECMHVTESGYAGFPHLYFYSNPSFAKSFVDLCKKYKRWDKV